MTLTYLRPTLLIASLVLIPTPPICAQEGQRWSGAELWLGPSEVDGYCYEERRDPLACESGSLETRTVGRYTSPECGPIRERVP